MKACIHSSWWGVVATTAASLILFSPISWAQEEPPPSDLQAVVTITTIDGVATEQSEFIDSLPDTAEMQVHRTGNLAEPLTVFYLVHGTATNGKDYAFLGGEITVPAGESSAPIFIVPLDDNEVEPRETVVVTLIPKEMAPDGEFRPDDYHVAQPERASAVIRDDDVGPNIPPLVVIMSPPPGAILSLYQDIFILAEALDSDGWVKAVEFFVDGVSIGVAEHVRLPAGMISPTDALTDPEWCPPHLFRIHWKEPTPGLHLLSAVAEDNLGAKTESEPVEVQVLDLPEPTVVHVLATDPEGGEGPVDETLATPDSATFTLVRSGRTDFPLEVFFELAGTAVNGVDYKELPTSAVIPAGTRSVDVVIEPIDDLVPERTETVTLTVIPPVCIEIWPPPPECYIVGEPAGARAFIRDNDPVANAPPRVRMLYPHDGQVVQGPADLRLTVAAWDSDGAVVSVEFFAGDRSLGVVTVPDPMPVPGDTGDPDDPSLAVPHYSLRWNGVPPGQYTLSVMATDDDGASTLSTPVHLWVIDPSNLQIVTVEASDPDAAEPGDLTAGPEVLDTGRFTLRRTGPMENSITVYYRLGGSALNGVDYEELPHRATIPAGGALLDLEVRPLHDELVEGTEHVVLQLVPPCCLINADGTRPQPYILGEPASARVAIHDNDEPANIPPRVKIKRPVDGQVFVAPREIELVAVAQDPDGWVPRVQFFDGEILIGTSEVTFFREPDPGFPMTYSYTWKEVPPGRHELTARAMDNLGAESTSVPVRISVLQPEILPMVTIEATDPRASEGGLLTVIDSAIFTVHRTGDLTEPLTVFYNIGGTAKNGSDYQALSGAVVIPSESATAAIEVIPIADNLEEDVETVIVKLEPPVCTAEFAPSPGCYMVGEPSWAVAGIVDGPADGNVAPRAEMVRPFPGAVYHAAANIAMATQARDRDGYVTQVEWFADGVKIGEQTRQFFTAPPPGTLQVFDFSWRDVPPGRYLLTTRATDEQGAVSAFSEPVDVTVLPANDVPFVSLFIADPLAAERPLDDGTINTATFKVRRSGSLEQPLTVFYDLRGTADNGADYVGLERHVTIPAGSRWARIDIRPVDDPELEGPETVVMELVASPVMGPVEPYRLGTPRLAAALIVDADDPSLPLDRVGDWIHLQLRGEPGTCYRLEVSDDLQEWRALTDEWAEASGVHHIETAPETSSHRFYRLRPLAPEIMESPSAVGRDW